jgi:uncharacterized protein
MQAADETARRNIEVLEQLYAALNRGDIAQALSYMDADIEWQVTSAAGPSPGIYRGHAGVEDAVSSSLEVWADYRNEPLEFVPVEDAVVVRVFSSATGKGSGVDVGDEVAHLWKLRDGRVVRFEAYRDSDDALAAARVPAS